MLSILKHLVAKFTGAPDERLHPISQSDERIEMLNVEEPMAGAGALLDGSHIKSETELALERAASHD